MTTPNSERFHVIITGEEAAGLTGSSAIRIMLDEFFADIVCDKRSVPHRWHWIVQREGSPEIVMWGHENSREESEREAQAALESFARLKNYKRQKFLNAQ